MKAAVLSSPGRVLDRPSAPAGCGKTRGWCRAGSPSGAGVRGLPDRPSYCGRRAGSAAKEFDPRTSDCGRSRTWGDAGVAAGSACRRFLDWGNGRRVLVLQTQSRESLQFADIYRLWRERRIRGVCHGARRFCVSFARSVGRPARCAAAVCGHHRLP